MMGFCTHTHTNTHIIALAIKKLREADGEDKKTHWYIKCRDTGIHTVD